MAKLYFRYGAMGSSKTANALMVEYNYRERGKRALLAKPATDTRDGEKIVSSRMGLKRNCIWTEELLEMTDEQLKAYDCVIVDEAQFCSKEQVEFLTYIVDELHIPVICYGLRADFRNELFPGSMWLLAWADEIEEIKTVCWCGKAAKCNARFNEHGIVREGAQVVLGGNDSYIALCRQHLKEGNLGPAFQFEE
ncbi:MAG: thymidine kinase [Roseburia sp.]|uniref:thymidine kinase n=1 Tax=Roseburia sp. 831b TaxID=1261635 RepID=UPI00095209EB|nr:thymidine kinase [Roseburia sp. 831b]MCI5919868.1 thymidine kinase [Roseburia sp.]MDD6216910.1 thymidine kinase [Roseburia sp.]MDY5881767.1 thymidine kinase [Roseburia sp.]WVK71788.1 thymidine kinase [Roseburia sp. 831b]